MPSTFAIFTDTIFLVMMRKVIAFKLFCSSYKKLILSIDFILTLLVVWVLRFETGEIFARAFGKHLSFAFVADLEGRLFGWGRDALRFGSDPIEEHNILLKLFKTYRLKSKPLFPFTIKNQIKRENMIVHCIEYFLL